MGTTNQRYAKGVPENHIQKLFSEAYCRFLVSTIQKTKTCETKYTLGGEVEKELISKSLSRARLNLLKLSSLQHQMLLRWFHDSRKTYNLVLRYVFDHGWHKEKYLLSDEFQPNKMKTIVTKNVCERRRHTGTKVQIYTASYPKDYSTTSCLFSGCTFEDPINQTQKVENGISRQAHGEVCP